MEYVLFTAWMDGVYVKWVVRSQGFLNAALGQVYFLMNPQMLYSYNCKALKKVWQGTSLHVYGARSVWASRKYKVKK